MPADAVPFVAAVCVAFSLFIVVVGGVSTWVNLSDRRDGSPRGG
jgi:hypothetical protein